MDVFYCKVQFHCNVMCTKVMYNNLLCCHVFYLSVQYSTILLYILIYWIIWYCNVIYLITLWILYLIWCTSNGLYEIENTITYSKESKISYYYVIYNILLYNIVLYNDILLYIIQYLTEMLCTIMHGMISYCKIIYLLVL